MLMCYSLHFTQRWKVCELDEEIGVDFNGCVITENIINWSLNSNVKGIP